MCYYLNDQFQGQRVKGVQKNNNAILWTTTVLNLYTNKKYNENTEIIHSVVLQTEGQTSIITHLYLFAAVWL